MQFWIDTNQGIEINRRKTTAVIATRSGRTRTAEYVTVVPWLITINPLDYIYYSGTTRQYSSMTNVNVPIRNALAVVENFDRNVEQSIFFNSPGTSFLNAYQGTLSISQLAGTSVTAASTNQITISSIPTGVGFFLRAGDYVQLPGGRYVYQVSQDYPLGSSTQTITVHRNIIEQTFTTGGALIVGNNCQFRVIAEQLPSYQLVPGAPGSAWLRWSSQIVLRENVT